MVDRTPVQELYWWTNESDYHTRQAAEAVIVELQRAEARVKELEEALRLAIGIIDDIEDSGAPAALTPLGQEDLRKARAALSEGREEGAGR